MLTFSRRLKFAMHESFLCKFDLCKCFASVLNLQAIQFGNVGENKVLVKNSEFTVYEYIVTPALYLY